MPSLVCGKTGFFNCGVPLLFTLWVDLTRDMIEELRLGSGGAAITVVDVVLLPLTGFSTRTAPI